VTRYVAGIDGGQSSTTAVIGDERGRIVGRGRAGPADEVGAGERSCRLRDALEGALHAALDDAHLVPETRFAAVVAGVSGFAGSVRGQPPRLPSDRVILLHDTLIAHAGALGGDPGVVVIAGTGSAIYATGGPRSWNAGGWGYLFGDEGSAFWLAREALAALMRLEDEGAPAGGALRAACEFFSLPSLRAIARGYYAGEISRAALAGFAPAALAFEEFRTLAERGAEWLATLACKAIEAGAAPTVAGTGGMFTDHGFARRFADAVVAATPQALVVQPRHESNVGALLLGYREAGIGAQL
jgi:N-acetylglucosamine kinase-like BadF-type ATPase